MDLQLASCHVCVNSDAKERALQTVMERLSSFDSTCDALTHHVVISILVQR